jgi:hypothetical protein
MPHRQPVPNDNAARRPGHPGPHPTKPNIDPALAALIDAWPALPEAIRAGILAMVRAAGG